MSDDVIFMILLYSVLLTVCALMILLLMELISGYIKACRKCREARREALKKITKTAEEK